MSIELKVGVRRQDVTKHYLQQTGSDHELDCNTRQRGQSW